MEHPAQLYDAIMMLYGTRISYHFNPYFEEVMASFLHGLQPAQRHENLMVYHGESRRYVDHGWYTCVTPFVPVLPLSLLFGLLKLQLVSENKIPLKPWVTMFHMNITYQMTIVKYCNFSGYFPIFRHNQTSRYNIVFNPMIFCR